MYSCGTNRTFEGACGNTQQRARGIRPRSHLQLVHGDDAVAIRIDHFLELLLPLPDPVVVDVLALLVVHGAHGQRDELRQRQLFVAVLVCGEANRFNRIRVPSEPARESS